jgi:hypothetical protein
MSIHSDLPSKQISAGRAMEIIRKASGMSVDGVKKNLRQFNSGAVRKISHNVKKNFITQKEMRSLLKNAEKSGMKISSSKISMAYNQINREEKKRKVQYGKDRDKMADRLTDLEQSQTSYKKRESSESMRANSKRERVQPNTGWSSSPSNSISDKDNKKEDNGERASTVVELPI